MTTITRTVTLKSLACSQCGTVFALSDTFMQCRRDDHETFYCPNGHRQYFPGKSDAERLAEDLARAERQRDSLRSSEQFWQDQAGAAERSARALRGHLTRLRRRIANGVCPCCQRSFGNVHRHIRSQHPQWAADHAEALAPGGA